MKRRQRSYVPTRKTRAPSPAASEPVVRPSVATIDTSAALGRTGIVAGMRVRILGSGLYAGETAVVERLVGGAIPAALVRTDSGRTRRARTVDLEPLARPAPEPPAE
jgi:hypothetical protein